MATRKTGYGIIGLGTFGLALTRMLSEAGEEVMVIDENEENLQKVQNDALESLLVGKLTRESLEETGITNCHTVIICITKVDVSVLTAYTLLDLGVPRVIGKAASKEHGVILDRLGAEAVYPETDTAARLAATLLESNALDMMHLNDDHVISEIMVPQRLNNCTVDDLHLGSFGLELIAVEAEPNKTLQHCGGGYVLHSDDSIIVIGKFSAAERFENELMKK